MRPIIKNTIIFSVLTALIFGSFWIIYQFGVNVPHWDDHAVRVFVEHWNWGRFFDIFDFHNEHRIALTRIAALKVNWLAGNLNFKYLMYLGQVGLLAVMAWFTFWVYRLEINLWWLLIPGLFIFNTSTYENSLWAMASVQNHWVIAWSLTALFLLVFAIREQGLKERIIFILAILASLAACFSSGNGILVFPVGVLILLFAGKGRLLGIWTLFFLIFLFFYFQNFERFGMTNRPHPQRFFINLFNLTGSFVYPVLNKNITTKWPLLIGFLQILFTLRVFLKVLFRRDNSLEVLSYIAFTGFILGTMVLVAGARSDYDVQVLLSSKYKIYSFLLFAVNTLYFFGKPKEGEVYGRKEGLFAVTTLLIFINTQVSHIDDVKNLKRERIAELVNLSNSENGSKVYSPQLPAFATMLDENKARVNRKITVEAKGQVDRIIFSSLVPDSSKDYYVWVKNENHEELVALNPRHGFIGPQDHWEGALLLFNFPSGNYRIYLLEVSDNKATLTDTDRSVFIQGKAYSNPQKNW